MMRIKVFLKDGTFYLYWYDKKNGTVSTNHPNGTSTGRETVDNDEELVSYMGIEMGPLFRDSYTVFNYLAEQGLETGQENIEIKVEDVFAHTAGQAEVDEFRKKAEAYRRVALQNGKTLSMDNFNYLLVRKYRPAIAEGLKQLEVQSRGK